MRNLGTASVDTVEANQTSSSATFVRFHSHRARDYGLRVLDRYPKAFYSLSHRPEKAGIYLVTPAEADKMRKSSSHARFDILKLPEAFNLAPCWEIYR